MSILERNEMEVVVICGTNQRGVTYQMAEVLKREIVSLQPDAGITQFTLPKDFPHFCVGCKSCFDEGEAFCPHYPAHDTIWQAVLRAKLLIFIYPMYVMRVPGQLKALLDHWGVHWISHRPAPELFTDGTLSNQEPRV